MLKPLLIMTSWKAYEPAESIDAFINETSKKQTEHVQYAFALPYEVLKDLTQKHSYPNILLGALHMNRVAEGCFTKEIAGKLLKKAQAAFVLIGSHFERDTLKETDQDFQLKIREALKQEIAPVLCVGETAQEHLDGNGNQIIEKQLKAATEGLTEEQLENVIVFFESPWMAQISFTPTPEEVTESYANDHKVLEAVVGEAIAAKMQTIHTVPEDMESFQPPSDKGVFVLLHHMHKASESAEVSVRKMLHDRSVLNASFQHEDVAPALTSLNIEEEKLEFSEEAPSAEETVALLEEAVEESHLTETPVETEVGTEVEAMPTLESETLSAGFKTREEQGETFQEVSIDENLPLQEAVSKPIAQEAVINAQEAIEQDSPTPSDQQSDQQTDTEDEIKQVEGVPTKLGEIPVEAAELGAVQTVSLQKGEGETEIQESSLLPPLIESTKAPEEIQVAPEVITPDKTYSPEQNKPNPQSGKIRKDHKVSDLNE